MGNQVGEGERNKKERNKENNNTISQISCGLNLSVPLVYLTLRFLLFFSILILLFFLIFPPSLFLRGHTPFEEG